MLLVLKLELIMLNFQSMQVDSENLSLVLL
nr:MAG TPA: hypothetical protein [Bacteriophage sp.]